MTRIIVMGPSGCGKSLIGSMLAEQLGATYIDADDLHPAENVEKMRNGVPLDDTDRWPWLETVGRALAPNTVIACSALRRIYRDRIRDTVAEPVTFVVLTGSKDILLDRVANRPGHYMPPSLVDSQLAAFEHPDPDEAHVTADIKDTPDEILAQVLTFLKEQTS